MTDPKLIDAKLQYLSEGMVNNWQNKAIAEYVKTSKHAVMSNYDLADFADAIAIYTNKFEDQAGLFFLANIKMIPTIRKTLGDYLKYTEAYIRTGAIGDILGVPIYTSKIVPEGMMVLATNEAVTAFIKKGVFVEQARDVDTKEQKIVASRYSVIALTNEDKCILCGRAMTSPLAITAPSAADVAVEGTGTNGAKVTVFVNGEKVGSDTVSSGAWSVSCDALVADDVVKAVAELEGYLPEEKKAVAE